jgi:hypothetical protein
MCKFKNKFWGIGQVLAAPYKMHTGIEHFLFDDMVQGATTLEDAKRGDV